MSKEGNKDFIEQQNKGFQRSIYWNEYKTKEQTEDGNANSVKYINLDPSFQSVRNGQQEYYLPRVDLKKYNVTIDGRNFYDNPIESDIEKYKSLK